MVIEGYVLGSPPLVEASFGIPTSSVGPRVPPSLLPLTPSCPLSLPSCFLSLPLAPNGQRRVGVCCTMFLGPHHLCGGKGQEGVRGSEGSERATRGSKGSDRWQEGVRGVKGSKRGARGEQEGSEREQEGVRGVRQMLY